MYNVIRKNLVASYFFIILVTIFTTHFLLSTRHIYFVDGSNYLGIFLDSLLMTGIVFPILYYFFLRPLTSEIKERKKSQADLQVALEKSELSDRLKTEFLAQMSHEIRTPINVLVNCAQSIKEELDIPVGSDLSIYIDELEIGSRRLIRTIESILYMSQLQIGAYNPTFTNVELKEILTEKVKELEQSAQDKGLQIKLNIQATDYTIIADKFSIEQIFQHLIENAINFTFQGYIEITLSKDDQQKIFFSISDTGIGISKDFLPKLFLPFTQEDQGYTRKFEGNGLGLALVKEYCKINNCKIEVSSLKGNGTTFKIIFL
ncbi:sensor histidine kinase [Stygiobacter electus]|uniref:histidine kinase n=1 Tax=Stygiobacter electus TaxID=3032292 RepID=A0AAE3NWK0_9BACT|nr:HAMP domain-containing sensor histidine kinase [Stygiobacter electus]MDF1612266.1 HAMP domain-containing sensor histidine kinase [Stygiobacter electus]